MTTICFGMLGREIRSVRAQGHAGYAEAGEDIVCAAVSALMQTTAIALGDLGLRECSQVEEGDRVRMSVQLPQPLESGVQHDAQVLLRALKLGLEAVQTQYPRFIRVITEHRRWEE